LVLDGSPIRAKADILPKGVREGGIITFRLFTGQPGQLVFSKGPARRRGSEPVSKEAVRGLRAAAIRRLFMYPEEYVQPIREELTRIGFQELRTATDVDSVLSKANGTVLVVVNSVCGCAAGRARPAVAMAIENKARPEVLTTVFAGQDADATARARTYFTGYAPSSPSVALLRDGKLVFMLERKEIEGRDPYTIAEDLTKAFDQYCSKSTAAQAN